MKKIEEVMTRISEIRQKAACEDVMANIYGTQEFVCTEKCPQCMADMLVHLNQDCVLNSIWDLETGDQYYTIHMDDNCVITPCKSTWANTGVENGLRLLGNVFLTKEECENEIKRKTIESEMLKLGGSRDPKSIGDIDIDKYFLGYSNYDSSHGLNINCCKGVTAQGTIYFKSAWDCQQVIDKIGEDNLMKYLFYAKREDEDLCEELF